MNGEYLNEQIRDFFGKKANSSNSYWIPEKIHSVDESDSKIVVLIGNENNQEKLMCLDVIYGDSIRFEETFENYISSNLTLMWEEKNEMVS
jgi:hypothetical protein